MLINIPDQYGNTLAIETEPESVKDNGAPKRSLVPDERVVVDRKPDLVRKPSSR